jgi:hypothetical protein
MRLTLSQNQPRDNERFDAQIEKMTGTRRNAGMRERPRLENKMDDAASAQQYELGL